MGAPFDVQVLTGDWSAPHGIAQTASGALPHEFIVAAYTIPSAQISPVAVALGGNNTAGAAAASPVCGLSARIIPSAGSANTKFGPRPLPPGPFDAAAAGTPLAGASDPRAGTG